MSRYPQEQETIEKWAKFKPQLIDLKVLEVVLSSLLNSLCLWLKEFLNQTEWDQALQPVSAIVKKTTTTKTQFIRNFKKKAKKV